MTTTKKLMEVTREEVREKRVYLRHQGALRVITRLDWNLFYWVKSFKSKFPTYTGTTVEVFDKGE